MGVFYFGVLPRTCVFVWWLCVRDSCFRSTVERLQRELTEALETSSIRVTALEEENAALSRFRMKVEETAFPETALKDSKRRIKIFVEVGGATDPLVFFFVLRIGK